MKQIFLDIDARLQAQVPEIRWIDMDLGQLDQETPPVSYPCALISFVESQVIQIGAGLEEETLAIEVKLGFLLRERTHSKNNVLLRDVSLSHLNTVEKVRAALNGLSGETYAALQRTGTRSEPRADLRVYVISFSAVRTVASNDPDPEVGGGSGMNQIFLPIGEVDPNWPGAFGFESDIRLEKPPAEEPKSPFA